MAKKQKSNSKNVSLSHDLAVLKTYKMFIGGAFPRTESGRFYAPMMNGKALGNICLASRKDFRNAVVAARNAQTDWAGRAAYNRGQILYRVAEMLDGRRAQFVAELVSQGHSMLSAEAEVRQSIDRMVVYAGWCDKFQQLFSCVNPVATGHFNFSILEPTGVVVVVANEELPLLGLISLTAPIIAGGNSCIVLASESKPLSAITFAEVLATSDLPGGVVNILTGKLDELAEHFARHLDVNAIAFDRQSPKTMSMIKRFSADNVKRFKSYDIAWLNEDTASPYLIQDYSEVKTTWHPIEKIGASGSGY